MSINTTAPCFLTFIVVINPYFLKFKIFVLMFAVHLILGYVICSLCNYNNYSCSFKQGTNEEILRNELEVFQKDIKTKVEVS